MSFDYDEDEDECSGRHRGTKLQKYTYYAEYILTRAVITGCILGFLIIFWEGWVEGSAQYTEAKKTVDICNGSKDILLHSDHLRHTCSNAEMLITTYPSLYAIRFTLTTVLNWLVFTVCQIGASWITSSIMGLVFTMLIAYVYKRVTGPSNPYSVSSAIMAQQQQANFASAMAMANAMCSNRSSPPRIQDVNDYSTPIDFAMFTTTNRRRQSIKVE